MHKSLKAMVFNRHHFQYFPFLVAMVCFACWFLSFPTPNDVMQLSTAEILNSSLYFAITSVPYRYSLLISIGLLLPLISQILFTLFFSKSAVRRMDLYLLLSLVTILEALNIYSVYSSHLETTSYFWNYFLCDTIQALAICNHVFSMQMFHAKNSNKILFILCLATLLTNSSFLFKIAGVISSMVGLFYVGVAVSIAGLLCNIYVAYNWYTQYVFSKQRGLQSYQQDILVLGELLVLIFFQMFDLILKSQQKSILTSSVKFVVTFNVLITLTFYGVVEFFFLRMQYFADSSTVSVCF